MAYWPPDPFSLSEDDRAHCRAAIRVGSTSFHAASLLLPKRVRLPARALYAFCRASDDAVDLNQEAASAADRLKMRLDRIYAGQSSDIANERAFAALVRAWRIPYTVPAALIEGFAWDEGDRRYATLDDLLDYCARVAGTVGIMMTILIGRRDPAVLARAADLGLAMQLTNIARDVGEDARQGRVYLPLEWLAEAGIDHERLLVEPRHSPALGKVVQRLLAAADTLYDRALTGLSGLPLDSRPAICAAALIYRAIGDQIAENDFNSVDQRAFTSQQTKLKLAAAGAAGWVFAGTVDTAPPHASTRFLVEATAETPVQGFDAKVGRAIELLALSATREYQTGTPAHGRP